MEVLMRISFTFLLVLVLVCPVLAQQAASSDSTFRPKTAPAPSLVPPGVPKPNAADAARIAEVLAFEKEMEAAVVRGDVAFLERALAPTFIFTHGDGWVDGGEPLKVDTKASWIEYVKRQAPPYVYRELDHVQVELHGDIALTLGRYFYLPRPATPGAARSTSHMYVWFERVYAKTNGRWQHLSHRTIKGPVREDDVPASTSTR
jgi:hypothetical protein